MKRCISIILAILLFINSGGFIIIYYQLLHAAKKEMFINIREGNYNAGELIQFSIQQSHFRINVNGFLWKDDKEFEYKNCLYDIIKISEADESLTLYCINDKTEEKIQKSFNSELKDFAKGDLRNSKLKTRVINLVTQALIKNSFELPEIADAYKYFPTGKDNILLNEKEIPSPPPKSI